MKHTEVMHFIMSDFNVNGLLVSMLGESNERESLKPRHQDRESLVLEVYL